MPTLRETYDALHAALRGEVALHESATALGVSADRLAIYVRFVEGHIGGILEKQFPRVAKTLPPSTWHHVCQGYFKAHPPSHWELNQAAEAFPDHLADQLLEEAELSLFHVSMAQLEWAQWCAFSDPTPIPALKDLHGPIVNPTLTILELPCPVIDAALSLDRGEALAAPLPDASAGPEQVLIFRHPSRETSAFWRATERLIIALASVDAQLSPEASAAQFKRPLSVVNAALERAKEIGLLIAPDGHHGGTR